MTRRCSRLICVCFRTFFLRLIKTIVAPLILTSLITGIAGHGDLKQVGRMGVKSLVYFEVLTTLALVIGLAAIQPDACRRRA